MLHHENIASFFCIMTILKRFLDEVEGRDGVAKCDQIWQIFHRLGKNLSLVQSFQGSFNIWQNFVSTLEDFDAIGQVFIVANDQILKN